MGLKSAYLAAYNIALLGGWSHMLLAAVQVLLTDGHEALYPAIEKSLQIWQTAALLEILHSVLGIVRAPLSAALPQILSRIYLTWGILYTIPQTRTHILVASLIISWAITEVIRYGFFAFKEGIGEPPYIMKWLRYSTFLLLYPSGILSELGLIYVALPHIKESKVYNYPMPNALNFAFDYYMCSIATMLLYIPGSPYMYMYMMAQRKKVLQPKKKEE